MKTFFAVIGFLVLFFLSSIWYGYVLSVLWNWFVVLAFHTSSLGVASAIGVSIVVRMFTYSYPDSATQKDKTVTETLTTATVVSIVAPLVMLLCGAVVHLFV